MLLSDIDIRRAVEDGLIEIDPFERGRLQPASYDVRLGRRMILHPTEGDRAGRLEAGFEHEQVHSPACVDLEASGGMPLMPFQFALGVLYERLTLGNAHAARLDGRSTLGRMGLMVHITAGFVDPGWDGNLTVELLNVSGRPITLYPLMDIGQLTFEPLTRPCERPYGYPGLGSHYQGDTDVMGPAR